VPYTDIVGDGEAKVRLVSDKLYRRRESTDYFRGFVATPIIDYYNLKVWVPCPEHGIYAVFDIVFRIESDYDDRDGSKLFSNFPCRTDEG